MRTLVEPPPSQRCDHCGGELRLKQVTESTSGSPDLDEEIFVCVKCGREKAYAMSHDRYQPHLNAS